MKRFMGKIIVMVGTLLILGLSANAQMSQRYVGDIPFGFQVDGHDFAAGKYTVGPQMSFNSTGVISITSRDNQKSRLLGLVNLSGTGSAESAKLIFVNINGNYKLSEIQTPTFVVRMKRTWTDVKVGKNRRPADETVAINLQ